MEDEKDDDEGEVDCPSDSFVLLFPIFLIACFFVVVVLPCFNLI